MSSLYPTLQGWIKGMMPTLEGSLGLQSQGALIEQATAWLPSFLTEKLVVNNNPEIYAMLGVDKLIDYIVVSITNLFITGIAIAIAWIVVKIILAIGVGVLDLVSKLPILRTANQLAGGIVGALRGVLFVWIGCILVPFLVMLPELAQLEALIKGSVITKMLYENNLLLQLIMDMLFK